VFPVSRSGDSIFDFEMAELDTSAVSLRRLSSNPRTIMFLSTFRSLIGLFPHPTDSEHDVVLCRIGEGPVISQFDAKTFAIVPTFTETR
jgi:hypothetical protein